MSFATNVKIIQISPGQGAYVVEGYSTDSPLGEKVLNTALPIEERLSFLPYVSDGDRIIVINPNNLLDEAIVLDVTLEKPVQGVWTSNR